MQQIKLSIKSKIIIAKLIRSYIQFLYVSYCYINFYYWRYYHINFFFNIFVIVLDPRLKLEYMKDNCWERVWIDNTKKNV